MKKSGYNESQRKAIEESDITAEVILDDTDIESQKNSHMVVAALIVTVTFAAGFTMPGGYNSEEGSAILSKNAAFKTFIVTDAMALLMSTCALFFHFTGGYYGMGKRRMRHFIDLASSLIMLAIILMLIAFAAGAYSVIPESSNIGVVICIITSIFVIICYLPLRIFLFSENEWLIGF